MTKNEMPPRSSGRGAKGTRANKPAADVPAADVPRDAPAAGAPGRQRVAKAMARAGLCSRRDAEAWVLAGRVAVNGEVLASPARDIGPGDVVLVDGEPMPAAEKTRLFLFHKPRGLVTSDHDPEGRDTVAGFLRDTWPEGPRVVTIGRLDINTEGLLLLTNDGGLARVLELPDTGWLRRYRVRAKGETTPAALEALAAGITVDGMDYAGIEAKLDRQQGSNCWLTIGLREGKNREIKRVLEHLGLEVNRLIRLSFGPFQLADLPDGAVEEVRTRVLRDQLGPALAAAASVDFEEMRPGADEASAEPGGRDGVGRSKGRLRPTLGLDARGPRRTDAEAPAEAQVEPRRERQARIPGGPRRHVSALRATAERPAGSRAPRAGTGKGTRTGTETGKVTGAEAPRTRIERTSTKDRHDRTVAVEHLVRHRPEPERLARGKRPSPSAEAKRVRVARSGGRDAAPPDGGRRERVGERRGGEHRAGSRDAAAGRPLRAGIGRGDEPARLDRGSGDRPLRRSSGDGSKPDRADYATRSRPPSAKPPGRARPFGGPDGGGSDQRAPGARPATRGAAAKGRSGDFATGKPSGSRGAGGRSAAAGRPATGRAAGPRASGGKAPEDRPAGGRSGGERSEGGRPAAGRPAGGRPGGDRSAGGRFAGGRPAGDRPAGGRSAGGRPGGGRPAGDRPAGKRPAGDRPAGKRVTGDRPAGDRPSRSRPGSDRPAGSRSPGRRSGPPSGKPPSGRGPRGSAPKR